MTVYLVRHGQAGIRNDFDPHDTKRPLDDVGRQQARQIGDWLQYESVASIHSSPLPRCVQTVEPLSKSTGIEIELHDDLQEGASVDKTWALLESVAETNAVVCSHGDLIPEIIARAHRRGTTCPTKIGFAKGSVWVLDHWNGTTFETALYTQIKVNGLS